MTHKRRLGDRLSTSDAFAAQAEIECFRQMVAGHLLENAMAENKLLRKCVQDSETNLRVAATLVRRAGEEAEAQCFERNAAACKTLRMMVTKP